MKAFSFEKVYDVPSVRLIVDENPWKILKSIALRDARNLWFLSKKNYEFGEEGKFL